MKSSIPAAVKNLNAGDSTFLYARTRRSSGNTPKTDKHWKKMNGHYHRSNKGGGEWEFFDLPEQWTIQYHHLGLSFNLKPFSFKHTGLFPEQAANWDWFSSIIKKANRPVKILNLLPTQAVLHVPLPKPAPCNPCRRFQRHGGLGQGKCQTPPDCLRQVSAGLLMTARSL